MTLAPDGSIASEALCWNDAVTNDMIITTNAGTPSAIVSRILAACHDGLRASDTPCLLRDGICTATCTSTPSGEATAMPSSATFGTDGASMEYSTKPAVTTALFAIGAALLAM